MSARQRRATPSERRSRGTARRNQRSDLGARVLSAVPLVAIAIALVATGGAVFAAGLLVLAVISLRELFSMFPRARPVIFGGLLAITGLIEIGRAHV